MPKVFVAIEKEEREVVALEIVMVKEFVVAVAVLLSVTRMVIAEEPAAVGVPEMVPEELKERPAGSEPKRSVKVVPPAPPDEGIDSEKAELNVPLKPDDGVVISRADEMEKL